MSPLFGSPIALLIAAEAKDRAQLSLPAIEMLKEAIRKADIGNGGSLNVLYKVAQEEPLMVKLSAMGRTSFSVTIQAKDDLYSCFECRLTMSGVDRVGFKSYGRLYRALYGGAEAPETVQGFRKAGAVQKPKKLRLHGAIRAYDLKKMRCSLERKMAKNDETLQFIAAFDQSIAAQDEVMAGLGQQLKAATVELKRLTFRRSKKEKDLLSEGQLDAIRKEIAAIDALVRAPDTG